LYFYTKTVWIGAVWILGASMYLFMIPLMFARRRSTLHRTPSIEMG
jgi:hypothetical protein